MFGAGGQELERVQGLPVPEAPPIYRIPEASPPAFFGKLNPSAGFYRGSGRVGLPNLNIVPRGGMDTEAARTKGITPIGKFAVILLLFALTVFFLPRGVRGWFVLIILLGALTVNEGAIQEFQSWALGR